MTTLFKELKKIGLTPAQSHSVLTLVLNIHRDIKKEIRKQKYFDAETVIDYIFEKVLNK